MSSVMIRAHGRAFSRAPDGVRAKKPHKSEARLSRISEKRPPVFRLKSRENRCR